MNFPDYIEEGRCDFCHKQKKMLKFDKMHGIDCMDIEGYFCIECRIEIGLLSKEDLE